MYTHTTPHILGVLWGTFNQRFPQHSVRGSVRLLSTKTIQLENFFFDGSGLGEYFDKFAGKALPLITAHQYVLVCVNSLQS